MAWRALKRRSIAGTSVEKHRNSSERLSDGEARKEARSVDEICRAAAVMMCGRGVPLDVVASVLHVPLNRIRRWTERR